jgi:hypothetical protein
VSDEQKANLRKWVEALESGRYKQTRESLHKIGYCCLGVWCEIREGGEWVRTLSRSRDFTYELDGETVLLEDAELDGVLRGELGITEEEETDYVVLNDTDRANFKRIAQEIRKRHPEAFS